MPAKKKTYLIKPPTTITGFDSTLVSDLRQIILSAREQVARAVDSGLVLLYWSIGNRVRTDILKEKRAAYGKEIVSAVGRQLATEFGDGYSDKNLRHMIRFAEVFPDPSILQTLIAKLSWTHFKSIIYLDDPLKRDFYAEMCRIESWNTRALRRKIDSMLFERTALSNKPAKLAGMEKDGIRISSYWTDALPKDLLQKKLHEAVAMARAVMKARKTETANLQASPAPPKSPKPSPDAPTRQQGQFLAFMREYMMRNHAGVAPTHTAFQKFFNLTPPSVNSMLVRLEQRGFIKRKPGRKMPYNSRSWIQRSESSEPNFLPKVSM
jgi:hypothetical protein